MPIHRVFVANRGEIAVRILSACHALGLDTVLAASEADRDSLGTRFAGRTVIIGPPPAAASYLATNVIVQAARATGCDALHPGYGFLSEREELASLCRDHGIAFVGPEPETIASLGDKLVAREIARHVGLPLVPGSGEIGAPAEAAAVAERVGYPVLMKAAAGGGGRGMFVARTADELAAGFERAAAEAKQAFGDATLYLERYVENARHIEVQILGDAYGTVVQLGERDCSVQRRYQKVIEEAPAAALPEATREYVHRAALDLVRHLAYRSAGTVEFLYDIDRREVYFIEVNARIQVEHPVTEAVTGVDLVREQLRVAGGEPLSVMQDDIVVRGHAIECRVNAEAPHLGFRPSPGRITRFVRPHGDGIRVDTYGHDGAFVPPWYDSLIAKLVVHGTDREAARCRADDALGRFRIDGIHTNLGFLAQLLAHQDFRANTINTRWLERTVLPTFAGPATGS